MEDLDIWRSAHVLIDAHGDQAEFVAAGRIDAMIAAGDPEGETTWTRIRDAIRQLKEPATEKPH